MARTLMNMLPDFFLCRRLLHSGHDLLHILPDDGTYPLPTTFSLASRTKYDAERAIAEARRGAQYTAQKAFEEARQTKFR